MSDEEYDRAWRNGRSHLLNLVKVSVRHTAAAGYARHGMIFKIMLPICFTAKNDKIVYYSAYMGMIFIPSLTILDG